MADVQGLCPSRGGASSASSQVTLLLLQSGPVNSPFYVLKLWNSIEKSKILQTEQYGYGLSCLGEAKWKKIIVRCEGSRRRRREGPGRPAARGTEALLPLTETS